MPEALRRVALEAGLFLLSALALLRHWLLPGRLPGSPTGEGPQRLFEAHQLTRWLTGEAPLGQADLLAWPEGRGLWPVGPLIDALHTPLTWLVGDSLAMALVGVLLLTLAGLGPAVLARVAGAGRAGALAAGAMVQLSPYLLTNLDQMVIELGAIGVAALAAAAILHALRGGPWWPALVGIGATALCSPYYALFLALGCALTLPVVRTRRWLPIATGGALVCTLALAPFVAIEGSGAGRLSQDFSQGFTVGPGQRVHVDGSKPRLGRKDPRPQAPAPSRWKEVVLRWPAGVVPCGLLLLGLVSPRSRRWSALGLVFFLLGPGVPSLVRAFGARGGELAGPIQWLLKELPGGSLFGNPQRMLLAVTVCSSTAAALLLDRRRAWAGGVLLLLVGELWLGRPDLAVAASRDDFDEAVVDALDGPFALFPSGDPPLWMPNAARGETLLYAGRSGSPTPYDRATGHGAADLDLLMALAEAAHVPVGRGALQDHSRFDRQVQYLVLQHSRLSPDEEEGARGWLQEHAVLVVEGETASLFRVTSSAPGPR